MKRKLLLSILVFCTLLIHQNVKSETLVTGDIAITGINYDASTAGGFHSDNNVYTGTKATLLNAIHLPFNRLTDETTIYDINPSGAYFTDANPIFSVSANTAPTDFTINDVIENTAPVATMGSIFNAIEDNPVGLEGMSISDTDGDNQTITFTIMGGTLTLPSSFSVTFGGSGNGSSNFTVSGTLSDLNAMLSIATFTPTPNNYGTGAGSISFFSNDGTANSNTASITFDIQGQNDPPTISGLPTSITIMEDSIWENFDISSAIIIDSDAENGTLSLSLTTYRGTLQANPGQGIYMISGSGTNALTLQGTLADLNNYLNSNNIRFIPFPNLNGIDAATLYITVDDNGNTGNYGSGMSSPQYQVQINITPINDAPTTMTDRFTGSENAPISGNVLINDNDIDGDNLTSYINSIPMHGYVTLDSYGNFIYTPNTNFVGYDSFQYRVCDNNQCAFETVHITVTDINDSPTDITLSTTAINENVASGSTVGNLSSTDVDVANTFTYTLVAGTGDTDNSAFSISGANLQINASPDFEAKSSYSIRVRTTDQGGLSFEKVFTINVNNLNEAPTNLNLSATSINENVAASSTVGFLSSVDADAANTFTYSLVAGTGSDDNSAFSISGANLKINASPDFETKSSYSIRIRTTDQGGLPFEKVFTINVNNLNEAPINLNLSPTSINENVATGSTVGNLSSVDADAANTFTYSLVAGTGSDDNSAFSISGTNLQIVASPDFEAKSSYSIRVRTTDQGGLTFEKVFTININDLCELNNTLTLSSGVITANQAGASYQWIQCPATILIGENGQSFTPTAIGSYAVVITIGSCSTISSCTLISSLDPNNSPTNITLSSTSINENAAAGSTIGTLSSTDADAANTFTYSLVAGTGDTDNSAFSISGANLQINASPDFETKSSYSIRVRTTDQGGLSFEKVFTINVNNLNETPTNLNLSATSINENIAAGSTVGNLSSVDADAANTFTYSLVAGTGDTDNSAFSISGANLQINASPDFETKSSYSIRVKTTDQGGLSFEKVFTINVNNLNETPTNLNLSATSINENIAAGSTVGNLSSVDADAANTFTYSLVSGTGSDDNSAFSISGTSLQINASPDFETKSSYSIRVRTTDQGGLSFEKAFIITINDVLDNTIPSTSDIVITGSTTVGQVLTGSYTYSDPNGNPEGSSEYQWYRSDNASRLNKTAISGANSITYTLVMADKNKFISFEVRPNDGIEFGMAVESDLVGAVTTPITNSIPELLYYRFDGTGNSVTNYASAPPVGTETATIIGALSTGTQTICAGALTGTGLSSATNYVDTNWAPSLSSSWTISFKSSNIPSTSTISYVFGDVNSSSWRIFTGGVAGAGNWILRGPTPDVFINGGASTSETTSTWVYDSSAGNIKAYLNGVLVSMVPVITPIVINGLNPLKVGGYTTTNGLIGNMDEFRLYSRALTDAEVLEIALSCGVETQVPMATVASAPTVTEDTPEGITGMAVSDGDGDDQTLSFTITGGTLEIGATGITFGGSGNSSASFTASGTLAAINTALASAIFTPNKDLYGTGVGSISFVSNDGSANSNTASVTFNIQGVNDDPTFTGLPASITLLEDESNAGMPGMNYLNNALSAGVFSDIDAGANEVRLILSVDTGYLSIAATGGIPVTLSGNGTQTVEIRGTAADIESYIDINTNTAYTLIPNSNTPVTFTLRANDSGNTGSGGGTDVALGSFVINITPVNDVPVAVDDAVTTLEDVAAIGNVLTNDSDPDGNALIASLVVAPVNGTIVLNANGSFTYTPNANFYGSDSFRYQACDNGVPFLCNQATVYINVTPVNDAPVAVDDTIAVQEDIPLTGNVLTNDSDPESNALTSSLVTVPMNGTVVLNANGNFTYTPNANYIGMDSFNYQVCDNGTPSLCDSGTLVITVGAVPAVVTSVTVPTDNTYGIGQTLDFTVNFNKPVNVNNSPNLNLTIGTTSKIASLISGSGTNSLIFRYTILEGDKDSDGISILSISLNGGTILSSSGTIANLTLNNVGSTSNVLVNGILPLTATTTSNPVSCFGGTNGTATATPSGGISPYTYSWSNGQSTATATGLTAGTYSVTVTDANSSQIIINNIQVGSPVAPITATTSSTPVSCFGGTNGTATVTATGGTGSYTYSWGPSSGGNAATATGLVAGTYSVTITDANACTATQSFTITEPSVLTASAAAQTNIACNGNATGSSTVSVTGGTGAYTYSWAPSGGTSATASGLTAGTYTVTVTDANLCSATQSFTITEPLALSVTPSQTNVSCYNGNNGEATVLVTGGISPYTYQWSNSTSTAATASNLAVGTYVCTITDKNNCTISQSFTITQPANAIGLITMAAENLTISSAALTIKANPTSIDADQGACIKEVGLVYSTAINPTINDTKVILGNNTGTFSKIIDGLQGNTMYYVRAFALNNSGYINYGNEISFTTEKYLLKITASQNQTKVYGTTEPILTYTATGFVNGDTNAVLTGSLNRELGENTGSYTIKVGNLNAGPNYHIDFVSANFEITKADQIIKWDQDLNFGCDDVNELELNATSNSGLPISYSVQNNLVAEVISGKLTIKKAGTTTIAAFQDGDENHNPASQIIKEVQVSQLGSIIQHWDDVLFFDNRNTNYTEFQWYKNGAIIPGAMKQFYSKKEPLNGIYHLEAKDQDGNTIKFCPLTLDGKSYSKSIKLYPNPVASSKEFTIECDYSQEQLKGAVIDIYDLSGKSLITVSNVSPKTQVIAPSVSAVYIVILTLENGKQKTINLLVR